MTLITFDMALEALNAAVDEKGSDYVYKGGGTFCAYQEFGEPSCIVGNALHCLGVPIRTLAEMDQCSFAGSVISSRKVLDILEDSGFVLDDDAVMLLTAAQVLQDDAVSWGDAVRVAREETEEWYALH